MCVCVNVWVRVCAYGVVCTFCPHIFHFDTHISATEPKLISDRQIFHSFAVLNIFALIFFFILYRSRSIYLEPVGISFFFFCFSIVFVFSFVIRIKWYFVLEKKKRMKWRKKYYAEREIGPFFSVNQQWKLLIQE